MNELRQKVRHGRPGVKFFPETDRAGRTGGRQADTGMAGGRAGQADQPPVALFGLSAVKHQSGNSLVLREETCNVIGNDLSDG